MGHHRDSSGKTDSKAKEAKETRETQEVIEKPVHPFLEKSDLTYFSVIKPLLSSNGQKAVNFLLSFGDNIDLPPVDLTGILNKLSPSANSLPELLPILLSFIGKMDLKNSLDPTMLSPLLSIIGNKKED